MKVMIFLRVFSQMMASDPPSRESIPHNQSLEQSLITTQQQHKSNKDHNNIADIWDTKNFIKKHVDNHAVPQICIKQLLWRLKIYWIVMIFLTLASMTALLSQPFFIRYIKQQLTIMSPLHLVSIFLCYKIITSILYVVSDYFSIVLGVRMYALSILRIITVKKAAQQQSDNILWTVLQDDCEKIINLPYASINTLIKVIELVILCGLIISHLHQHKFIVVFAYFIFVVVTVLLARCSFFVSRKMLAHKERRLDFDRLSQQEIRKSRSLQLGNIKILMLIDGLGVSIPWLLNTFLMILIYGFNDLSEDDRIWVLTVFGLLRISISGLGYNMNLLAQIRNSLNRINTYLINYLKDGKEEKEEEEEKERKEGKEEKEEEEEKEEKEEKEGKEEEEEKERREKKEQYRKKREYREIIQDLHILEDKDMIQERDILGERDSQHFKYVNTQREDIIDKIYTNIIPSSFSQQITIGKAINMISHKCFPKLKVFLSIIVTLVFIANFAYSKAIKNIAQGISIYNPFNLSFMFLQFLSPLILLGFMCLVAFRMSKIVYQSVLSNYFCQTTPQQSAITKQEGQTGIVKKMNSEEMNRLSGDIRLLDRHFYYFSYATVSHFLSILASLAFSIVGLGIGWAALTMFLLTISTLVIICIFFNKFIKVRKRIYVKQAQTKGSLFQKIITNSPPDINEKIDQLCKIFCLKMFGYATQNTFMAILYSIMTIISTIFMGSAILCCDQTTATTLIMLVLQLDSQFLFLFIQRIQLQIDFQAIGRCLEFVKNKVQSK